MTDSHKYADRTDQFWIDLNKKAEAAHAAGATKGSVLEPLGVRGNAYSYHCIRLGLPRAGAKGEPTRKAKQATKPNGKFIEVTAKEPTLEINYKGALITLRNPTSETLKQILNALE
jgi:hypothetical protein